MKLTIKILILFFLVLGISGKASAHATPITYEPNAGVVMDTAPSEVVINFSERIDSGASSISVFGPNGSQLEKGKAGKSESDPRKYFIEINNGGEGTYTVSWQIVSSDDGHFTKGAYSFSVGKETAQAIGGQVQIQHITTLPQAFTIGIELLGQALILGALFFLIFFSQKQFDEKKLKKTISYVITTGATLVIFGAILFLILKTFDLIQLRAESFSDTLNIFLNTVDGKYALVRGLLGVLALVTFWVFRKDILKGGWKQKGLITLVVFVAAMILIRARVSHAAASHFLPIFSILVNAFQLFFKEVWVGGVIVFGLVVSMLQTNKKTLFEFIGKYSKLLNYMFVGVGITGAYVVWLHLKDTQYLFRTEWGSRFVILSVLGGLLLLLRLCNQFLIGSYIAKDKELRFASVSFLVELFLGVALIFVTSLMIITTPPYRTEQYSFERNAESGNAKIEMTVYPYESSNLLIVVSDKDGKEMPLKNLVVAMTNTEKGIGPVIAATTERFVGGYAISESQFAPAGNWKVDITATPKVGYDAVASFTINYPTDIQNSLTNQEKRKLDLFALACILAAVLIGLFGYFLNAWNAKMFSKSVGDGEVRMLPMKYAWPISLIVSVLLFAIIFYGYNAFLKTDFQKLCERNGHFWLQSVPVKDGKALSKDTVTGCFLDVATYHFADEREYRYFYQRKEIIPEVTYSPETPVARKETKILVDLSEVKEGRRVEEISDIAINHDRILHVLVVGEDMKTFSHIHSEDLGPITDEMKKSGKFPLTYNFPKAGTYVLNLDYVISGIEYTNVLTVKVSGEPKMEKVTDSQFENKLQVKEFDGYTVTFNAPENVEAGEMVKLHYHIEKEGRPVTDLEPYLGAAMHLGMVRNDLGRFFHTHGEALMPGSVWFQQLLGKYYKYHMHFAPDKFGPNLITPPFATKFTTPGVYTVFGEFKHKGKVIVTDFQVRVK